MLCIFLIYEDRNWRKYLGHQIQSIAVTDDSAIKLLKNVHNHQIRSTVTCFSTCYQKFKINSGKPKIILSNGKNTDVITRTSSPTSLQYEVFKKKKKQLRIKNPSPSRWTQKADPGICYYDSNKISAGLCAGVKIPRLAIDFIFDYVNFR